MSQPVSIYETTCNEIDRGGYDVLADIFALLVTFLPLLSRLNFNTNEEHLTRQHDRVLLETPTLSDTID